MYINTVSITFNPLILEILKKTFDLQEDLVSQTSLFFKYKNQCPAIQAE